MKRILTVVSGAVGLTLLAGCASNDTNGTYYGGGYSGTASGSFGYRQPYPYTGYYQYNDDRRNSNSYYSRDPYYYGGPGYYRR
jgi:hypothetical protein